MARLSKSDRAARDEAIARLPGDSYIVICRDDRIGRGAPTFWEPARLERGRP